ncbi:trans-aconitate 2-methyltransferase [Actinomadura viridis]|uniref:Trans-aconitate 2-methyltransferase n=1 Tax=Actinomadura viridis TaxID=58110 RepID=A0A931DBF1_9ACTN|nr:trans-aconitate 2-methyltransferase [Actinomadura viridis]MBG6087085.1 trans-aconitate 2-methyltransferase [Actinomadura viridis]
MSRQAEADRPAAVWDPEQYGVFGDERARPFAELLARVDPAAPRRVADLGCGTGELTAALARRWPDAVIEAFDSSPEMIEKARARAIPGRLDFTVGDVRTWRPAEPVDLIVSNAVLQWVPEHVDLLPRWIGELAPGGRLAFQVPGNFDAPSHTLLRELCDTPRWRGRVGAPPRARPVLDPVGYLDLLTRHGYEADAWETTYAQVLHGEDAVLEWLKGTTLRPVLTALGPAETSEFLSDYGALLRAAYPPAPYGTVFPFRRVFVIAGRAGP